jgi:5'/3'-nucleotidase SurE
MAVSLSIQEKLNYEVAAETTLDIFLHFEETLSRQKNLVLNVNIPDVAHPGELNGWKITELADRFYFTKVQKTTQNDEFQEYVFIEEKRQVEYQSSSDYWSVVNSEVSITPLRPNLTDWLIKNELVEVLSGKNS